MGKAVIQAWETAQTLLSRAFLFIKIFEMERKNMSVYKNELNDLRATLNQYALLSSNFEEEMTQAQKNYTESAFQQFTAERKEQLRENQNSYAQAITDKCDKLIAKIKRYWEPKAALYQKDVVDMLESPYFTFSLDTLNRMATENYADNPTMLQVLHNYAKKNQLFTGVEGAASPLHRADGGAKVKCAEDMKKMMITAIQSPNQATIRTMDAKFDEVFRPSLDEIGEI